LLILVEEEAVRAEDLVERVGGVEAHERQLIRGCRLGTGWPERVDANRTADDGSEGERDGRPATQGLGQVR
jgi:hypothetical protein